MRKYHLPATASVVPATCGNNSGSISIIVTDSLGVPPYQYAINGGSLQNSNTFTGLYAGSYPVLVVDSRGCDTAFTVSVNGNATLSHTLFVKNAFCAAVNNTGSVTITPTTGIGPYFQRLQGLAGLIPIVAMGQLFLITLLPVLILTTSPMLLLAPVLEAM
ncbi:MAG: SprB repeat-containing protein [Chitinophagaceae bacterium]|nr:SprB repeat-containing protein [Chitinophagaceae bacterium]